MRYEACTQAAIDAGVARLGPLVVLDQWAVEYLVKQRRWEAALARQAAMAELLGWASEGRLRPQTFARHPLGGMDEHGATEFDQFLVGSWSRGRFVELREDGQLLAVAVTDVVADALSAVYTFYAPEEAARSLGTYAILRQVQRAKDEGREHLYLGFWLDGHPKMAYKRGYRPLEFLDGAQWRPMPA